MSCLLSLCFFMSDEDLRWASFYPVATSLFIFFVYISDVQLGVFKASIILCSLLCLRFIASYFLSIFHDW